MKKTIVTKKYIADIEKAIEAKKAEAKAEADKVLAEVLAEAKAEAEKKVTFRPNDDESFLAFIDAMQCIAKQFDVKITKMKTHEAIAYIKNTHRKAFAFGQTRKIFRVLLTDALYSKVEDIAEQFHHINEANKQLHHTIECRLEDSDLITDIVAKALA